MDDHPEYPNKKYVDEAEVMSTRAEKEEVELDENRRAARAAGGYKDDSKKQTDPSKAGFTGISGSIKDIMRQNKEIEARNKAKSKTEALDPVGKEDGDVDNDGKKTTSDKYIMKRREAIRKAIASKKKVSEQLGEELVIEVSGEEKDGKIKEKKVNNKILINPELKESISEIGGEVLFISEVDEVDSIAESVHIELIEEGYSEDQVVEAIKYAIDEVTSPAKVASFKMKKAKYTPKPETREEPKKSLKDRIKSVAKKALDKASETAGKIMKKKAEIQAAPAKAKKKLGSYVDRAKAVAKAGYEKGRGPVEKKPTSYRGAGVGRKEKIGEEVASNPKMQQLQKKQIMLDRQKLAARVQAMQKKKPAPEQAQEEMSNTDQMQKDANANRDRAAKLKDRNVSRGSASLAAAKVADDVKKAARTGPQQHKGTRTGVKKIEKPKPTYTKTGAMSVEELSIADQMRISREAAAKRKPYKDGDHQRARAAQMRNAAKKSKKDNRTDAERMADAYASPRKGPGGATRAD
jgi:CDGSH-type Zn-finger protein